MNRGGYSDDARVHMERVFHGMSMPRYIEPGETQSGFVLTHAEHGAKGFNVDLIGSDDLASFTFLLRVPGFTPDYANVNFDTIYAATDVVSYAQDDLLAAIRSLPCCGSSESSDMAAGVSNVVLVSSGDDVLSALLRSNWIETAVDEAAGSGSVQMFGRKQDAIFRYQSIGNDSVYELRLWLAPVTTGDKLVWVGQVRHHFTLGTSKWRPDPDVDIARNFALQKFFYGQALEQMAWVAGDHVIPFESYARDPDSESYFTDGYSVVLWLSADPVSMLDVETLDWDVPPGWRK